jgi:hypothetical protein
MVEKIVLAALILLPAAGIAADAPPVQAAPKPAAAPPAARDGKGAVRLDEVRITGSPEHPGVLFFLPRTRFHLLPLRTGKAAEEPPPGKDRGKGAPAR